MRALILIVALLVPSLAHANKSVGLLVTGDYLKAPTQTQAEKWFRDHDQKVVTNALPADAVKTLMDCFVIDDPKCSRGLIDARATTDSLVSIRIDIVSKKDKDVRLTIDWFVKGRNPVSARRTCEDCTENVLRTTVDAMLLDLAKTSPSFMGRIKVSSAPPGITVLLDNETIGVTPVERDVTAGKHLARLVQDGRMGTEKSVKIEAGSLSEITLESPPAGGIIDTPPPPTTPHRRSRAVPVAFMIVGVAAVGAGATMYFALHKDPDTNTFESRDWKTAGMITAGAGGVVAVTGLIWFLATKSSSGPTVGATATGDATIGWSGRF
ncbi:MAG TPA: PEGA domain-containing protein [Kofleriaceae bacterium]